MNLSRPLYRSTTDRKIAGVAAGVADYLAIDRSLTRVLWLVLAIFTWGGFGIVYLIMWIVVPEEPYAQPLAGAAPAPTVAGEPPAVDGDPPTPGAPAVPPPAPAAVRNPPSGGVVVGAILIVLGSWFLVRQFFPELNFGWVWPLALVAVGAVVLVAATRRPG